MFRRNRKGMVLPLLILTYGIAPVLCATLFFCFASKRHLQQRLEKQATAEGRLEYPMTAAEIEAAQAAK